LAHPATQVLLSKSALFLCSRADRKYCEFSRDITEIQLRRNRAPIAHRAACSIV
jgi:hypothetical protein